MQEMTLDQFIARENITLTSEMTDHNPNMPDDSMHHYRCTLRRRFGRVRRSMTLVFSMGSALCDEPTAADVLDCLSSDSSSVEHNSFEDWASELGFDTDSRKAERTYKVCVRQARRLRQFLGEDAYDVLLFHTERL